MISIEKAEELERAIGRVMHADAVRVVEALDSGILVWLIIGTRGFEARIARAELEAAERRASGDADRHVAALIHESFVERERHVRGILLGDVAADWRESARENLKLLPARIG